jgi:hypothetical protein
MVSQPADFVGRTIRVDGVASAVCEAMGAGASGPRLIS